MYDMRVICLSVCLSVSLIAHIYYLLSRLSSYRLVHISLLFRRLYCLVSLLSYIVSLLSCSVLYLRYLISSLISYIFCHISLLISLLTSLFSLLYSSLVYSVTSLVRYYIISLLFIPSSMFDLLS